tara:strand:- start:1525 stop:2754 length:1230 start_codon:yes stop_codon:yes gene_type:complete
MNQDIAAIISQLEGNRDPILQEWLNRRQINAAKEGVNLKSRKAWMDHLPQIFDELIDSLRTSNLDDEDTAEDHAQTRLKQGFDLAEAILDLSLLEELILDTMGKLICLPDFKYTSPDAVHEINRNISVFINGCIVESSYTYLRRRDQIQRNREIQLRRRIDSLGGRLRDNLKVVGASAHDLKGSTDVLVRLANHALNSQSNEQKTDPVPLLRALSKGLAYNQQILDDLSVLSIHRPPGVREDVQAEEIIRTVSLRCAMAFGDANYQINWKSTEPISLFLHRLALERILANLISNAFSHGSDAPISISYYASPKSKNQWYFEIENELRDPVESYTSKSKTWVDDPTYIEAGIGLSVVTNLLDFMEGQILFSLQSPTRLHIRTIMAIRTSGTPTHDQKKASAVVEPAPRLT